MGKPRCAKQYEHKITELKDLNERLKNRIIQYGVFVQVLKLDELMEKFLENGRIHIPSVEAAYERSITNFKKIHESGADDYAVRDISIRMPGI